MCEPELGLHLANVVSSCVSFPDRTRRTIQRHQSAFWRQISIKFTWPPIRRRRLPDNQSAAEIVIISGGLINQRSKRCWLLAAPLRLQGATTSLIVLRRPLRLAGRRNHRSHDDRPSGWHSPQPHKGFRASGRASPYR